MPKLTWVLFLRHFSINELIALTAARIVTMAAQIDKNTWTKDMLDLLMEFIETDDRAAEYRGLDWSHEYDLAINGDPNDTQSAL